LSEQRPGELDARDVARPIPGSQTAQDDEIEVAPGRPEEAERALGPADLDEMVRLAEDFRHQRARRGLVVHDKDPFDSG
jgi:hypothetical protein